MTIKHLARSDPNMALLVTELYDLQSDPYELVDVAAQSRIEVETLVRQELIPWLERTDDPFREHLDFVGGGGRGPRPRDV